MIVLDSDVLSALMRKSVNPNVVAWLDRQDSSALYVTAISIFEIGLGLEILARGRTRTALTQAFNDVLEQTLDRRILPLDADTAHEAARLAASRRARGRPIAENDTFIGAIAVIHGASIATRNTRHFEDLPVTVVNPWDV